MSEIYCVQPSEVAKLTPGQLDAYLSESEEPLTFPDEESAARYFARQMRGK